MFNKFKRLGTVACKVQITIDLNELTVLDRIDGITRLCIELERGKKSISSSSKIWSNDTSPSIITFGEQLVLMVTLYRDSSGNFVEKKGKINLRGNRDGDSSSFLLGFVDLKLNRLASNFETQHIVLNFKESKGKNIGTLKVSSTSKFLNNEDRDDASSMMSFISDSVMSETSCRGNDIGINQHPFAYNDTSEQAMHSFYSPSSNKESFRRDSHSSDSMEGVLKDIDEEDNDNASIASVAAAVQTLESKELRHLLKERKKMMFELEKCETLIDSLELKNKILTEDHEYVEKKHALGLIEEKKREMETLIDDLKLKVVQLEEREILRDSKTNVAKSQISDTNVESVHDEERNRKLLAQLNATSSELKTSKKLSDSLREQLEGLKVFSEAQRIEVSQANDTNMQLDSMLTQMRASKETEQLAFKNQKDFTEQMEIAFKVEKAAQQQLIDDSSYELQQQHNALSHTQETLQQEQLNSGLLFEQLEAERKALVVVRTDVEGLNERLMTSSKLHEVVEEDRVGLLLVNGNMKEELVVLRSDLAAMKLELTDAKYNLNDSQLIVKSSANEINVYKDNLSNELSRYESLCEQLRDLKSYVNTIELDAEQLKNELSTAKAIIGDKDVELADLNDQRQSDVLEQLATIRSMTVEKDLKLDVLIASLGDAEDKLKGTEVIVQDLLRTKEENERQILSVREECSKEVEREIASRVIESNDRLSCIQDECASQLMASNTDHETHLLSLKNEYESVLAVQVGEGLEKEAIIQAQLSEKIEDLRTSREQLGGVEKLLEGSLEELSNSKEVLSGTEVQLCDIEKQVKVLKEELVMLKEQSTTTQKILDERTAQSEVSNTLLVSLEKETKQLKKEADELAEIKMTLEGEMISDKATVTVLQEEITRLQVSFVEMADEKMSLDGQIVELMRQVEADKVNSDELLQSNVTSNDRVLELECLVKEERESYVTLEAQSNALQKTQDELVIAKQIADDRIDELDSEIVRDKKRSDELAEETKVVSDIYISELKIRLTGEEAASLILKEQCSSLEKTLAVMGSDQTDSCARIVELESEATKNKVEKILKLENELKETIEFSELETIRHEEQIISLLKMTGLYELDLDPRDKSASYWAELNSKLIEEERLKIQALKSCLIRFSSVLNADENDKLLNAGIILD